MHLAHFSLQCIWYTSRCLLTLPYFWCAVRFCVLFQAFLYFPKCNEFVSSSIFFFFLLWLHLVLNIYSNSCCCCCFFVTLLSISIILSLPNSSLFYFIFIHLFGVFSKFLCFYTFSVIHIEGTTIGARQKHQKQTTRYTANTPNEQRTSAEEKEKTYNKKLTEMVLLGS